MVIFQSPKHFFRGQNLQENHRSCTERALLAKFQAPKFENSEPEKNAIPYPHSFHTPTKLPPNCALQVGIRGPATGVIWPSGPKLEKESENCQGMQRCNLERCIDSMWMLTTALLGSRTPRARVQKGDCISIV